MSMSHDEAREAEHEAELEHACACGEPADAHVHASWSEFDACEQVDPPRCRACRSRDREAAVMAAINERNLPRVAALLGLREDEI